MFGFFLVADVGKSFVYSFYFNGIKSRCFLVVGTCTEFVHFPNKFYSGVLPARLYKLSYLLLGVFLSSTLITGIGTSMIILRIISATRRNPSIRSLARYWRIQRIIIESGIIYLLSLIATGATLALVLQSQANHGFPPGSPPKLRWPTVYAAAFTYSQALLIPIAVRFDFL